MKILFGLFLIAHGLVHALYFVPKPEDDPGYPFYLDKGWFARLTGPAAVPIGAVLATAVVGLFVLAGLGTLGVPGLTDVRKPLTAAASLVSLMVFALYPYRRLWIGVMINAAILAAVLWFDWP